MGLAVLLLVTLIFIGTESCAPSELEKCLVVLQSVAKSDDLALATTKHDLQHVCRKLQQGVKCIDEHSSRCFNTAQQRVYDSVVSESRQVIEDLCVEGDLQRDHSNNSDEAALWVVAKATRNVMSVRQLNDVSSLKSRKDYLLFAPCFKNISTDSNKCAPKYRKMAKLSQELKEEDKDTGLKSVCCALKDFTVCKHEFVIRDCGPTASQFLQRHMDRMSGSLINEHCVLYTYGTDSCSSNSRHSKMANDNPVRQLFFMFVLISIVCWL